MQRQYPVASVESDSPMSEEYRSALLRLLANQARAELYGAHQYSKWISRAPSNDEKRMMAELAHEEIEHWYVVIKLMRELGVSDERIPTYESRNLYYNLSRLTVLRLTWTDILMGAFLIDRGAYFLVEDYAQSSYAPWARAARSILEEEVDHVDFGYAFVKRGIETYGKARVQRAFRRWWPISLNMFGPPRSKNTELHLRLGLKYRTNEERRQAFRQDCEPKIAALGLDEPKLWRTTYPFL